MNYRLFSLASAIPIASYLFLAVYAAVSYSHVSAGSLFIESVTHLLLKTAIILSAVCIVLLPIFLCYQLANWPDFTPKEQQKIKKILWIFCSGALVWLIDYSFSLAGTNGLFVWYLS